MQRHLAFTLTELLTVVAILAILSAILLPAIGMVRTKALSAVCANHLRQMHLAAMAYADAWEGRLAADRTQGGETSLTSPTWFHRLPELLDLPDTGWDRTIFHCPRWRTPANAINPLKKNYPRSFKQNDYLEYAAGKPTGTYFFGNGQTDFSHRHYQLGSAPDQRDLLLFADAEFSGDGTTGLGQWGYMQESMLGFSRHSGQANGITIDGNRITMRAGQPARWWSSTWDPQP
jgi:prepilin-type N-terminal cleavage/methylation domain-containing protein